MRPQKYAIKVAAVYIAEVAVKPQYASLHTRADLLPPLINTTGNEVNFIHTHLITNSCSVAVTNTAFE